MSVSLTQAYLNTSVCTAALERKRRLEPYPNRVAFINTAEAREGMGDVDHHREGVMWWQESYWVPETTPA